MNNSIDNILKYHLSHIVPIINVPKPDKGRSITWQKWFDPLGGDFEEAEWPGALGTIKEDKLKEKLEKLEEEIIDMDDDDEEGWSEDNTLNPGELLLLNKQQDQQNSLKQVSGIVTPMGIIPVTEHTRAGSVFNFWTAHANFRMTKEIFKIIDDTDGVETFDVYTPYRWRVSIGKAFNSQEVKQKIAANLEAKSE